MADEAEIMRSHHPLHKMVLCCTSVEMTERNEIQRQCEDMGARHILDLTSEVTHLICGELFSPKYRYVAKMRIDVKVMTTKWVEAMYTQWIGGEDIDPRTFEAEHRLPVFYNLKISVTGIADVAERKRIEEICQQESASYHPDLTYAVSHLIAAAPTGKKYEFARAHRLTVVTPEWLADSLERGMALDEKSYDPLLAPEEIGVGAKPSKTSVQTGVAEFRGKRKIRKATQDKLGGQSQTLWDDIVGQAANVKPVKRDEWEDGLNLVGGMPSDKRNRRELGSEFPVDRPAPAKGGMFANVCFWIWGFEDKQMAALKSALLPHDGTIVNSPEELSATSEFIWKLVMVPREKRVKECPKIPEDQDMATVTEWWLESCLHYKKFVTPMGDFTTMPIEEFEIEEMKGMDICITKFTGIDLLYYPRLARLLGANFHDVLRKNRTLLITNNSREDGSQKIRYAHDNNIPVVTGEWLVECLKQHRKLSYEEYLIKPAGKRSLLGDKFKRKPETELASTTKRALLESVRPLNDGGSGEGKKLQQPNPSRSIPSESESKSVEGKKILKGCTVCVSKQLKKRKEELEKISRELGALVLDTFDENTRLTHLIHWPPPGKSLTFSKDYRVAHSIPNCLIVTSDWLYKCQDAMTQVDEVGFHPAGAPTTKSEMEIEASESVIAVGQAVSLPQIPKVPFAHQLEDMKTSFRSEIPPRPMPLAPRMNSGDNDSTSHVMAAPLTERTDTRANEISSSSPDDSMDPPERKASNLSGISSFLGKLGKDELVASTNAHKKTRGRLQGKAVAGKQRIFSRTPSAASMSGNQSHISNATPSAAVEPSLLEPTPEEQLVQSQALGYNYEETLMEKKIVRAKLDKSAPIETPRAIRASRVQKPRGAVDLVPTPRRSGRRGGGGSGGI